MSLKSLLKGTSGKEMAKALCPKTFRGVINRAKLIPAEGTDQKVKGGRAGQGGLVLKTPFTRMKKKE